MLTKRRLVTFATALCALTLLASSLASPRRALAQGAGEDENAYSAIIKRALSEFSQAHWEEAHALFRRAHDINPNARTWRGLGITAFESRRYVEATADLEAALVDPRKPLSPEQREETVRLIAQAREFISVYHVKIQPASAQVIVDGKQATLQSEQLHLDPGPHTIVVRAPGYEERRAELRAAAGDQDELSLELSVSSHAELEEQETSRPRRAAEGKGADSHPPKRKRRRIWTWALAGGAGAAAVTAVALRLRVRGVHREFTECTVSQGDCSDLRSNGLALLKASYVMAGVAGALFVGATVAFFAERETRVTTLSLTPLGLAVGGTL